MSKEARRKAKEVERRMRMKEGMALRAYVIEQKLKVELLLANGKTKEQLEKEIRIVIEDSKRHGFVEVQRQNAENEVWKRYVKQQIPLKKDLDTLKNGWELSLIQLIGYVLPEESREEWIGDCREALRTLAGKGVARWKISAVTIGRLSLLIFALLKISFIGSE